MNTAADRMAWIAANIPVTIGRHGLDIMIVTGDDKVAFAKTVDQALDDLIERHPT